MRVAIYTLGCKVNQYESQAMEGELLRRGHDLVPFEGPADAYIVNTCTVTAVSDKKSRQMIRRARKLSPNAVVAVCGCYAQTKPGDVEKLDVDLISGTGDRMRFLDLLESAVREREPVIDLDQALRRRRFEVLPAGGLRERTRAMLKVEDGCVNFCSYCIIPYARGPVRSLPIETAVEETRRARGGEIADAGGGDVGHRHGGPAGVAGGVGQGPRRGRHTGRQSRRTASGARRGRPGPRPQRGNLSVRHHGGEHALHPRVPAPGHTYFQRGARRTAAPEKAADGTGTGPCFRGTVIPADKQRRTG